MAKPKLNEEIPGLSNLSEKDREVFLALPQPTTVEQFLEMKESVLRLNEEHLTDLDRCLAIFPDHPNHCIAMEEALRLLTISFTDIMAMTNLPEAAQARVATYFAERFAADAAPNEHIEDLPTKAPELWSERDVTLRESPSEFVRRVYDRWLDKGLSKPLLRKLDMPLYQAFSVWSRRHPDDERPQLPSLSDVIDRRVAKLSSELPPDELRRLGLALQNRQRKKV